MTEAIRETDFDFPGQVGEVYHGKVGDVYAVEHAVGDLLVVVRSDRISAFDAELPRPVPHKGQVLNEMSAELLKATADVAPNWLIEVPDPNVSVGFRATPFMVEMIMRGNLLGTAWRDYHERGMRQLCDNKLPDGMQEFQPFDVPLLTPTTKADKDKNITRQEILERGLATEEEYAQMSQMAIDLYARGQEMADRKNLLLPDTKYEFGRLATGQLVVIDEVHTPDSSRYFPKSEYDAYLSGDTARRPEQLSKEFVREWLAAHGFMNKLGETMPDMPDDFVEEVSDKYIGLYERMLGRPFRAADHHDPLARIEANVINFLDNLTGA